MRAATPAKVRRRKPHRGFCIYINTFFQGPTLSVRDGDGWPCVFPTENAAQREIVSAWLIRLDQFLDGQRDFIDAITVDEYVIPVKVLSDGSVVDEAKRVSGKE